MRIVRQLDEPHVHAIATPALRTEKIKIVRQLDETRWREFVDNHPHSQVFHTPEMSQVFARAGKHHPTQWAAVNDDGGVLALLLPVELALLNGPLRPWTTRAVVYGSVLCAPGAESQSALSALLRTYRNEAKSGALFTELRNLSDLSDTQPILRENGFTYSDHLNFLVDTSLPVDAVWNNIHKSARKKIKQALNRNQLDIEEADDRSQVATCYNILQKTYATAHVPLADRSLFEAAFDVLHAKGMVKFLLGRVRDTYVAASVALLYKDVIYGWYRGFDRSWAEYLPNDVMVWHILKWGAENGYRTFDFGGAGRPDEKYGPRSFKAKFGGRLVNYGRNLCVHAPFRLRMSETAYHVARRFLS
jgi:CelD/BcsL family acetyltransferase involved in cellulose biosynthesis